MPAACGRETRQSATRPMRAVPAPWPTHPPIRRSEMYRTLPAIKARIRPLAPARSRPVTRHGTSLAAPVPTPKAPMQPMWPSVTARRDPAVAARTSPLAAAPLRQAQPPRTSPSAAVPIPPARAVATSRSAMPPRQLATIQGTLPSALPARPQVQVASPSVRLLPRPELPALPSAMAPMWTRLRPRAWRWAARQPRRARAALPSAAMPMVMAPVPNPWAALPLVTTPPAAALP